MQVIMSVPDDPESFQLLHQLPQELLDFLLSNFCDGKSLWTLGFALSVSSDAFCEQSTRIVIPSVVDKKLLAIAATLEEKGLPGDVINTRGAVEWIEAIVSLRGGDDAATRMRHMFENTAVLDFLRESLNIYSDVNKGHLEWPIWCGKIMVDSSVNETRMRNTAAVVLTAPIQRPSFISAVSLLPHHLRATNFRLEPYNIIPTPPWGKMRGLTEIDEIVLGPIIDRLEESNEVAVPRNLGAASFLDIRMMTQNQAQRLLSAVPWSPRKSAWIVESEPQKSLICFWQNDDLNDTPVELGREREYIPHIMNLISVRDQLMYTEAATAEESTTSLPADAGR
jgi:hypothetical protein